MGKDRYAPHTQRFAALPDGSCLYVAELSNGYVKVGCSASVRGRMMALASESKRFLGADVVRFHVVKRPTEIAGRRAEVSAIARVRALGGEPVTGHIEFFRGIPFEVACAALPVETEKAGA